MLTRNSLLGAEIRGHGSGGRRFEVETRRDASADSSLAPQPNPSIDVSMRALWT